MKPPWPGGTGVAGFSIPYRSRARQAQCSCGKDWEVGFVVSEFRKPKEPVPGWTLPFSIELLSGGLEHAAHHVKVPCCTDRDLRSRADHRPLRRPRPRRRFPHPPVRPDGWLRGLTEIQSPGSPKSKVLAVSDELRGEILEVIPLIRAHPGGGPELIMEP